MSTFKHLAQVNTIYFDGKWQHHHQYPSFVVPAMHGLSNHIAVAKFVREIVDEELRKTVHVMLDTHPDVITFQPDYEEPITP